MAALPISNPPFSYKEVNTFIHNEVNAFKHNEFNTPEHKEVYTSKKINGRRKVFSIHLQIQLLCFILQTQQSLKLHHDFSYTNNTKCQLE